MNAPLTVYKASAGSGKTFTLTIEYIKLLIKDPLSYKQILAVTFTNKATEEMKMRILSQLYGLSRLLPDSNAYLEIIKKDTELSEEQIRQRSSLALGYLIHNYSYFQIQTIDTFFQGVLNNLARELDLTARLRVTLNDEQLKERAVDRLIEELDPKNKVLKWVLDLLEENQEENKAWNVISELKSFGKNIFSDLYKQNEKQLSSFLEDENKVKEFKNTLIKAKKEAIEKLDKSVTAFFDILNESGLDISDFKNGERGVPSYFLTLQKQEYTKTNFPTKTALNGLTSSDAWISKSGEEKKPYLRSLVEQRLMPLLNDVESMRVPVTKTILSVTLTLQHLNKLRLLSNIEKKVHEINNENNQFLLSDTQILLNSMIEESDSPFLFEKIGTRLEHIMIDEFQDTSTTQWKNFKILLNECLSHAESSNLIVGDVKQSIYRWRNGDWKLLNNIDQEFNHSEDILDIKNLTTNYRSSRNIITFNNAFFNSLVKTEAGILHDISENEEQQLQSAYDDVAQLVPKNKPNKGYVQVEFLKKEVYEEETLSQTKAIIQDLLDKGAQPKDIAIIHRKNDKLQEIANYLMNEMPHLHFVSSEAFKIHSSSAVNIIIKALKFLVNNDDKLALAELVQTYQTEVLQTKDIDSLMVENRDCLENLLPKSFYININELRELSLLNLIETIFNAFSLDTLKEQTSYVCTFYDKVNEFITDNGSNLPLFLNQWEDDLYNTTISTEQLDGITLITIHKCKGLEYKHVIMPFCDWKLKQDATMLFKTPEAPFSLIPILPIYNSRSKMMNTIFESQYIEEYSQTIVDNLNMLYVAFTRACDSLFVISCANQSILYRASSIQAAMTNIKDQLPNCTIIDELDKEDCYFKFEYGKLEVEADQKEEEKSMNIFKNPIIPHQIDIKNYAEKASFLQSNKSNEYLKGSETESKQQQYIELGQVLHKIFSQIKKKEDIAAAIEKLDYEGVIDNKKINKENLQNLIYKRFENPIVEEWFSNKWTVFNECAILSVDPTTNSVIKRRPDRVIYDGDQMIVIDFKFGSPKDIYIQQIENYMALLKEMGYKKIKGYLWFVYSNNIKEVK